MVKRLLDDLRVLLRQLVEDAGGEGEVDAVAVCKSRAIGGIRPSAM
jgi:hypothetical protein